MENIVDFYVRTGRRPTRAEMRVFMEDSDHLRVLLSLFLGTQFGPAGAQAAAVNRRWMMRNGYILANSGRTGHRVRLYRRYTGDMYSFLSGFSPEFLAFDLEELNYPSVVSRSAAHAERDRALWMDAFRRNRHFHGSIHHPVNVSESDTSSVKVRNRRRRRRHDLD